MIIVIGIHSHVDVETVIDVDVASDDITSGEPGANARGALAGISA